MVETVDMSDGVLVLVAAVLVGDTLDDSVVAEELLSVVCAEAVCELSLAVDASVLRTAEAGALVTGELVTSEIGTLVAGMLVAVACICVAVSCTTGPVGVSTVSVTAVSGCAVD